MKELDKNRAIQRQKRQESGVFRVALAGYTNAGKSSLLNLLTDAGVLSYDKLFATLDSKSKRLILPDGREVTLTDTVGFIQKLPTKLVESFKSTLDEIREADLVLHIVDAADTDFEKQAKTVDEILNQIEAGDIRRIMVFNKIDLLDDGLLASLRYRYPEALFISAHDGSGIDELLAYIQQAAADTGYVFQVLVPYNRGDVTSLAHSKCHVISEEHTAEGTKMKVQVSAPYKALFAKFAE